MKQRKVKKGLVLATYKDYVRHFGVKLGAKKWKEKKIKPRTFQDRLKEDLKDPEFKKAYKGELKKGYQEIGKVTEEVRVEEISLEKAKGDIRYRADKIRETILTVGWVEYIRPRIEACIDLYKSVYDDVPSYEELKVNQAVRKELNAILQDINGWINAEKELEKEEEDATNVVGKKGIESDDTTVWQSER